MADKEVMCACGQPLHYNDLDLKALVVKMSAELGEDIPVHYAERKYLVQRHYIALHGIKGWELLRLARKGIVKRVD